MFGASSELASVMEFGFKWSLNSKQLSRSSTSTVWMPIGYTVRGARWHRLANTTEPSVFCGDAAVCQMTLTACYVDLAAGLFGDVFVGTAELAVHYVYIYEPLLAARL